MSTNTAPTFPATQEELSNHNKLLTEPPDHGTGRSRGGLTTTIHALMDGNQRPSVMLLGPGLPPGPRHRRRHPGKERPEGQPQTQGIRRRPAWGYDKEACKRRNVVKRSFNTLKQWRSLATRYDTRALTYRSAIVLQAVVLCSTTLGDTH